jgi:hypothetical protein
MWFGLGVLLLVVIGLVIAFPGAAIVLLPLLVISFAAIGLLALRKRRKEIQPLREFRKEAGIDGTQPSRHAETTAH